MSDRILDDHRTWMQGQFIDGPEYRKQTVSWKDLQRHHEALLVRPSPKGNAICTAVDPETAVWIAKRLNLAAELEAKMRSDDKRDVHK